MEEIDVIKLKKIQLEMLKDIHSFCITNGIKYSLSFGTLLGAIRHKGYIPWDDDIDLMFLRKDYERFINSYGNDRYRIADLSVNDNYGLPFAKVEDTMTVMSEYIVGSTEYGVYIDIFPVDNVPENLSERKSFYRKKHFWNALYNLKTVKIAKGRSLIKNIILGICQFLLYFVSRKYLAMKLSKIASEYKDSYTGSVAIVAPADCRERWIVPSDYFKEYVEIEFENSHFLSIKEYDRYLTAIYGNYMQLPPKNMQVSHHVFKAWWKG